MKTLVVISTAGSEKEGWKIAQKLVEAKLAACVNVIPQVTSFFYWEGKLCQAQEVVLLIKTIQKQLKKIINEIKKIHSYETYNLVATPILKTTKRYALSSNLKIFFLIMLLKVS